MGRRRTAAWALSVLLGAAVLEIRTMASTRRMLPGAEGDDYVERIRMLAEVTHQLSPALGQSTERLREKTAIKALEWQWGVAPAEARSWIVSALDREGASITEFIDADRVDSDFTRIVDEV